MNTDRARDGRTNCVSARPSPSSPSAALPFLHRLGLPSLWTPVSPLSRYDSFTLQQLIDAVDGRPVGPMDVHGLVSRIETDSRRVRSGDLFWCLKGDRFDGHDFLSDVADRGAMACVVAERAPGLPPLSPPRRAGGRHS